MAQARGSDGPAEVTALSARQLPHASAHARSSSRRACCLQAMKADWDDDDVQDDWDDDEDPKPAPKAAFKPPARQAAAAPKTKAAAPTASKASSSAPSAPSADQKVVNKDSLKELELNLQQNVETLVQMVVPKLQKAKAKAAPSKFITETVRALQVKLTLQEAELLHKTCKDLQAARKKDELAEKKRLLAEEEEKKKQEQEAKGEVADEDFFADYM
uniref:Uncharacterized protein n=1 Tax=Zooxanthella nutricula TaxID=1333877 RepID=A0A7S2PC91_9DINO